MNIIANENVFEPIIEFMRSEGHNVISIRETSLSGASDDEIYELAVKNKFIILTMDERFFSYYEISTRAMWWNYSN